MEVIQAYQTKNGCYKAARKANHIGILVHATGVNNCNLKRYVDSPERLGKNQYNNHWNNDETDKCMHAFIGYDKNKEIIVAQTLPYNYACWGCGKGEKGSYNRDPVAHIQFEICQGSNTDANYYKSAIGVAEEYCAYLCKKYGWTAKNIVSHKEAAARGYASNHSDPESWMKYFNDNMDKFRERVNARLGITQEAVKAPQSASNTQTIKYITHTVKRGESLWNIARKHLGQGARYKEIMELNNLKSDKLKVGQILKIPSK